MKWTAPPDRRELTLLLFSLIIYLVAYNLDTSLRLFGLNPSTTQGVVLTRLGLGGTKYITDDGRKPEGWRDDMEEDVYGSWPWDKNHIAGEGLDVGQPKGTGRHGAMWMNRKDVGPVRSPNLGETRVDQALVWWQENVPKTKLVKHVPGYTILDNVILFNGTMYIVTNEQSSFPEMESIVSTQSGENNAWRFVNTQEGKSIFGSHGGIIRDVTWMSTDVTPHNSTLFALWRIYSSLDPSIDSLGRIRIPPPARLVFPYNLVYTDPNPPRENHWIRRTRVDTGFHPYLAKVVLPHMTCLYAEDWEDYYKMGVPFIVERMVIADRTAAARSVQMGLPAFSPPFTLDASEHWWEPLRRAMATYYDLHEDHATQTVVTYLHRQGESSGPKIEDDDHEQLVRSLKNMARVSRYELNIISTSTLETSWEDKMAAIARSTVVLGVHGNHLFDSMFMKRSPTSTLVEIFPDDTFERDQELAARSIGLRYIAMWRDRKFTSGDLPPIMRPSNDQPVRVDAGAVVEAIHSALS
ncbi:hypothetical protein AMATHDRAFT_146494 [Amanita thiersii Skay4041]|uniref:Uncharacterized protein n=1 Tax=Amanita thiersii Skay4041 TaxID=703135 RepID=A0A2A9NNS8_9AGAR|nr:hypothetical protein AMATHDRAFT_146494 [Amanita thiersii Skay4041]